MTEDIDYKALYEQVQQELEAARIAILNMRSAGSIFDKVNADSIRQFAQKNYVVIVLVLLLLSFIVSSLKTIKGLFKP